MAALTRCLVPVTHLVEPIEKFALRVQNDLGKEGGGNGFGEITLNHKLRHATDA